MLTNRLHSLRKKRGLTLHDISEVVNKDISTISRYEKGDISQLTVETLMEFAIVLDASPFYLLGVVDNPYFTLPESEDYNSRSKRTEIVVESNQLAPLICQHDVVQVIHVQELSEVSPGDIVYIQINHRFSLRGVGKNEQNELFLLPRHRYETLVPLDSPRVKLIGIARTVKFDLRNRK